MAENQNTEYKETWRDEYLKWICGFANAGGGRLLIGIRDNGEVAGVDNAAKLMEDIPNKVRDVLGLIVPVALHYKDGKEYIEIAVEPSSFPVNYKGEYHVRTGSTKQLLQGNALTQFLIKRTGMRWDAAPVDSVTPDDLDNDSFKIFRREAKRNGRMTEDDLRLPNEELLDKLGLTTGGRLKRAAVLLFHPEPERLFTGCYTKIALFNNEADIMYMDDIRGSLLRQATTVVDLLYLKYLKATITYDNITRVETYPYPRAAVREAVINALAHSNWAAGSPVQIAVYDDRMYISNDCLLHEGWTIDKLLGHHRSEPFNPDIANVFFRAGLIEAWGRGIEKMRRQCKEAKTPEPEFDILPEDLTICFKPSPKIAPSTTDLTPSSTDLTTSQDKSDPKSDPKSDQEKTRQRIVEFCQQAKSMKEIAQHIGICDQRYLRKRYIRPMLGQYLQMTIPDKPRSSRQKYIVIARKQ